MRKNQWVITLLSGLLLFHFISNSFWLQKDCFIYGPDSSWHFLETFKFHFAFKHVLHSHASFYSKIGQLIQIFRHWQAMTVNWPPLVYFLSAIISPQEMHLYSLRMYINFIFFILLTLSIYFLGKKCFNRRVGLIAAFLISFYPASCAFSRQFQLDFPLLCLTSACVCLLVYSENFSKKSYSLLFGLCLGIATLEKLQILIFLLAPLLYSLVVIFRENNRSRSNHLVNFILSSAVAFGLFYLYWGNRVEGMFFSLYEHAFSRYPYPFYSGNTSLVGTSIPILSLRSITYYFEGLLVHVYLLPFLLFLGALTALMFSKNQWRLFYLFCFLTPYFVLSAISVKWIRYALPLLVFMALISAWWIDSIRSKHLKAACLCVLVIYSLGLYLVGSWKSNGQYYSEKIRFFECAFSDVVYPVLCPPNVFDYTVQLKNSGVIAHIEQSLRGGRKIYIEFGGDNVEDVIALLYFKFQDAIYDNRIAIKERKGLDFKDADYVIMKDADLLKKNEMLKGFRVLSRVGERVFLIRNEEK